MGCDGGTIPTRGELVRLKKKPEQKDKDAERAAKWKLCTLTQEPLHMPIVSCELGRLYNKESVLEYLLDKSKFESAAVNCDHIRGLKDIKELQLTPNPAFKDSAEKGDGYVDRSTSEHICPITGLEMSGRYKFLYLCTCSCVLSERGLKEIKSEKCPKCTTPYTAKDIVILNGSEEEIDNLRSVMNERRLQAKLLKKSKKRHKLEAASGCADDNTIDTDGPSSCKVPKLTPPDETNSRKQGSSTSKLGPKIGSKLPAKGADAGKSEVKVLKVKSIQDDSRASKTYKSLFNTCEAAKNQPKNNWVTHNPLFY